MILTSMDNPKFSFRFVFLNENLDEVNKLNSRKRNKLLICRSKLLQKTKMLVGYILVPRWEMPFTFIGFMILEIRIQQNDRLPTDFLYLLPKPPNCRGKRIPHFPIGPRKKAINIKTETCPTKDPIKR